MLVITLTNNLIRLNKEYDDDLLFQKLELEAAYEANDDTKFTDINFISKSSSKISPRVVNANYSITTSSNNSSLRNNLTSKCQSDNSRGGKAAHHKNSNSVSLFKQEKKYLSTEYHQVTHDNLKNSQSYKKVVSEGEDKLKEIIVDRDYTIELLQNKIMNYKNKIHNYKYSAQDRMLNHLS